MASRYARAMTMVAAQPRSSEATALAAWSGAGAERYVGAEHEGCLALFHEPPSGLPVASCVPLQGLFGGGRHGPHAGPWLFHVGLWVPAEHRTDFLAWYEQEHLPMLLCCTQWLGCRFMEAPATHGCQFHAFHQLAERAALSSPARADSRCTPWFRRFKAFDWFDEPFTRVLYRHLPA
jgi:hypothetical protein